LRQHVPLLLCIVTTRSAESVNSHCSDASNFAILWQNVHYIFPRFWIHYLVSLSSTQKTIMLPKVKGQVLTCKAHPSEHFTEHFTPFTSEFCLVSTVQILDSQIDLLWTCSGHANLPTRFTMVTASTPLMSHMTVVV
jgi:hypothetical protein